MPSRALKLNCPFLPRKRQSRAMLPLVRHCDQLRLIPGTRSVMASRVSQRTSSFGSISRTSARRCGSSTGTPGGVYTLQFHRLLGDLDGDDGVDEGDLAIRLE